MPGPADTAAEPIDDIRIREILSRWWGFETLRPLQADAIRAALAGRDSLVVMPTGGGKSLGVPVATVEKTIRRAGLQNRLGVTATTQGAIQVTSMCLGLECAHYFGQ